MSELKPCPFCGSTDVYETYSQEYALGTKNPEIFCNSCKAIFSIEDDSPYMDCVQDYAYRKKKTAEAWNKRVTSAQERKTGRWIIHRDWIANGKCGYVCSECGRCYDYDMNYCGYCGAKLEVKG